MGFVGLHRLVAHPDHRPHHIDTVEVEVRPTADHLLMLVYRVRPTETLTLPDRMGERLDGLWRTTCFELFAKNVGASAYREFNFAPVSGWAAYSFSDWRIGMAPLDLGAPPHLVDCRLDDRSDIYPEQYELDVVLGRDALPAGTAKVSLSAVIEETDGAKSFWALKHPPGRPNFHHPDCFVLELPAPERP